MRTTEMARDLLECRRDRECVNTRRPLTHSLDLTKEGLAMKATREVWKPIPGYEGAYEASSFGRIRSLDRTIIECSGRERRLSGRVLIASEGDKRYLLVSLNSKTKRVHRLVLAAFEGEQPDLQVRHLDGDPQNNRIENLVYGTNAENMQDCLAHGTHGQASKTHCRNGHPYAGDNVRYSSTGERVCRTCRREQGRRRQAAMTRDDKDVRNESRRRRCKGCGGRKEPGRRWRYCLACRPRRVSA